MKERLTFAEFWHSIPAWTKHFYGVVITLQLGLLASCWLFVWTH